MTRFLIKLFIKNKENIEDLKVREKYGILAGGIGICCNFLLSILKFIIGSVTHSISITADATNNLSDCASSLVTVVSFKLAGMPADKEHPFGHGRFEYIASLIVSFLVLFMGFELVRSSIGKIFHPELVTFSFIGLIILFLSILAKLWMSVSYRFIGKTIHSTTMIAASADSRNDVLATAATVFVMVFSYFSDFPIDGYIGLLVALFILYSGIGLLKDTVSPLLGEAPDPNLVKCMEEKILSYEGVMGIHDLVLHNYGPGRTFASAHVEVSSDTDILESHDTIDRIERDISAEFNLSMVIHMDPIITNDKRINQLHEKVRQIVCSIDSKLSIHDFRVVDGPTHTNLIFDVLVPHKYQKSSIVLTEEIREKIKELNQNYYAVITIDTSFVD